VVGPAQAKTTWHTLPVKYPASSGEWFRVYGWASGRFWFGVGSGETIWSAKPTGGRLTSFVSTRVTDEQLGQSIVVGSSLVVDNTTAAFQSNGKVGSWVAIPGDPAKVTDAVISVGGIMAGVVIGGRTVWAAAAGGTLGACCTAAGAATNLGSLLVKKSGFDPSSVRLGVDQQGRLWLAWTEAQGAQGALVNVHLAQLDPATLKPLSSKSYGPVANGGGGGSQASDDFTLVCADSCRLVMSSLTAILSWDGTSSPTKLIVARLSVGTSPHLLAAAYRGNQLEIVTAQGSPDYGWTLTVRVGDVRGAHSRTVIATRVPQAVPHPNEHWNAYELRSAYTPTGFVALGAYPPSGRKLQPITGALLHG